MKINFLDNPRIRELFIRQGAKSKGNRNRIVNGYYLYDYHPEASLTFANDIEHFTKRT
jgi:hypothetical protein